MYKIEITKTEVLEKLTSRSWVKGGPHGRDEDDGEYGYTPQIPEKREITSTALEMRVKDMDVAAVVNAILDNSESV